MKKIVVLLSIVLLSCKSSKINSKTESMDEINLVLDNWHKAAAEANFANYFDVIAEDGIFIGTDASENWNKEQFIAFSKPYFDKGKAWSFKAIERNIYFSNDGQLIWFDELLKTQMKLCRGSGVLIKTNTGWKIKHYVLSMTIPNENVDDVVKIKTKLEDIFIEKLEKSNN